tara:strand:+ start:31 stop:333 length:303 start_codon:yes stop_codon:yes gene_type:complete
MLSWAIQVSVISLIIIFLIHHLFTYFKTTLTVPQVKDLINQPTKRYEEILDTLSYKNQEEVTTTSNMKDELKKFLEQQSSITSQTTPIATLNSFSNYSQF